MQHQPGTIVVGIDGSPSSAHALTWAARRAAAERRALTLVHTVQSITPAFTDAAIADPVAARAVIESAGTKVLDDALAKVERTTPDVEVHQLFDLADPRSVLLHLSEDAVMVVVGSRGLGPVRSLVLGSVSVALVRHAHCPVVVVRPQRAGLVRRGVLVGVDASPESQPVLEFAHHEASLRDLPLTVVHCQWDIQAGTPGAHLVADSLADLESERLVLAEAMAGLAERYPDVRVTTHLAEGRAEEVLLQLGEKMDLVVVGAHQANRIRQAILGTVSVAVVEHATCPVAVVPVREQLRTSAAPST